MKYNLSQSFNLLRWCIFVVVLAFVAYVSVAKYIMIADMTSITFSALENTYLILSDTVNIAYIYLPLYLFLVCGIVFDNNFGSLEIIKCNSRSDWFIKKCMTLFLYTLLFFVFVLGLNFSICYQVFPHSDKWSSDFINFRVMTGFSPQDFVNSPISTITMDIIRLFFSYLVAGIVSLVLALVTDKESFALFVSLPLGIAINLLEIWTLINIIIIMLVVGVGLMIANTKDFVINRKEG
ncbi:MAG: hypothetical protein ATN35_11020 [Epulopiscium sp. Nele67-Bin004]|nr:MAG: hypothetical protein ATN35_11020 [Epulopiscium sp. Nele67-Bin004]